MTGKHKITRRIIALVLCAVLVLPMGGTGLGGILTSELWDSLFPAAEAATIEVNSWSSLDSAIATANSAGTGTQTTIKLSGNISDNNDGAGVSARTAITGNVLLDLNGYSITDVYYGTESGSGDNYNYQLPTNNAGKSVEVDTLTNAVFTVNEGATLQIYNSSSTASTVSISSRVIRNEKPGSRKTISASANLINCKGTLILGDINGTKTNFTLHADATAYNEDVGGSYGQYAFSAAMTISLLSAKAIFKMYGGTVTSAALSRCTKAKPAGARSYSLNIDNCMSADIYGGTISVIKNTKYYSDKNENFDSGIYNADNSTSMSDNYNSYFIAIRCNAGNVFIFDVASSVYSYAGRLTWYNGLFGAGAGGASLYNANIWVNSATVYLMGGTFDNDSNVSNDNAAKHYSYFHYGNITYPRAAGEGVSSWTTEGTLNAQSITYFTLFYNADEFTEYTEATKDRESSLWYGAYDSVKDWIDAGFDYTYDAHTIRKKTGTWDISLDTELNPLPLNTYKRTGYKQIGWKAVFAGTNTEVANVVSGISPDTFGGTGGTVFVHPTWTPVDYKVTYLWEKTDSITIIDPETGVAYRDGIFSKEKYYNIESTHTLHTPTRPGYDFAGWRPTADIGTFPDGSTAWEKDKTYSDTMPLTGKYGEVTLNPEWTPINYTITFTTDKNADGSYAFNPTATMRDPADPETTVSADSYENYNLRDGGTLPSVFKPGYTFQDSWKLVKIENGGGTAVGNDLSVGTFGSVWGNLTLLANLEPNKYTVTYVIPDDAKFIGSAQKEVTFDAPYGELSKAEREGYTFLGWSTVEGSNEPNVDSTTIYTTVGDTTLYACWSAIGYGVKLYYYNSENMVTPLNDGNAIPVQYDSPYGEKLNELQPTDDLRPGWEFVRWVTKDGVEVTADTIYKIAANSELYADLKESTYYLTFDENGGSSVADFSYKVSDAITLPTSTKTGYTLRWKAQNSAGKWIAGVLYAPGKYTGEYGTVDFIADWTLEQYKITFDTNGGVCSYGEINYNFETAVDATEFAEKYTPSRTGYRFMGWFVETSAGSWNEGEEVKFFDQQNHGNVTLVAKWEKIEYTLTFNLNGGEYDGAKEYAVTYTIEDDLAMIAPTRTAYTFNYWRVPNDINIGTAWTAGTYFYLTDVLSEKYGDVTLIAEWQPIQYTVSFNADGGTEEWNYSAYNTNQAHTLPVSTKAGYIFKGWIPDADAGNWKADTTYEAGFSVGGMYGNVSFTAAWVAEDFTATLNANGGELTEVSVGYTVLSDTALPAPVRDGYSFKGWLVEESVGSWVKNDETLITHIATGNHGNVNLIASWEAIPYDATFYSQNTLQTDLTVEDYTIENGITLPAISREHYTFMGWQPVASVGSWDASKVYEAKEYPDAWGTVQFNAVWEIYTYTVVWNNYDGSTLETDTDVTYGTLPVYDGSMPVRAADAQYTYTFVGWDPAVTPVAGENSTTYVYTAVFAQTVNSYTVTWQYETDEDDSTPLAIVTDTFNYGEMPVFKGGIPVKESVHEADHVWQFMGWSPAVSAVTGDVTYTAIFEKNEDPITITWHIDGDAHVTYGVTGLVPVYPTTPVLEKNDGYKYTFVGWAATENGTVLDSLPALGTEDEIYYAVFTKSAITYTATLIGNGGTVERDAETYAVEGDALELPVPVRNGYTFTGWKPLRAAGNWDENSLYAAGVLGGMIGDVTLVAQWRATEYTVTIYPADGSAEYDISYTIDGTQALPTVSREGYTFTGWYVLLGEGSWKQGQVLDLNESLANAYGDLTVQAQWQVNRYTVTWIIDGTTATETYAYGAAVAQRTVPEKLGYIAAWDVGTLPQVMPAENLVITAVYTLREYTITYNANGGEMPADYTTVYNITSSDALPVPTKTGSLFAGWQVVNEGGNWILNTTTAASATLSGRYGNVTLKAVWTPTIHAITWVVDGNERIAHWYYGAMPSYDGIPAKPDDAQYTYTFAGWDKEIVTVTGDAVYTALFDTVVRKYPVTWMLDDKVLEVKEYAYGETPDFSGADPIKPANALYAYTFAGWSPDIVAVEGAQTYYAQFTVYRFVQSVVLDYSNVTLVNGGTLQLTVSVYPFNADDPSVEWFSLDETIATVDSNGFVTAVGVGSTSICVRSMENPDLVAFCTIRVTPIYVTWLEITASSTTTLSIGEAVQLGYILRPDNATNIAVNWVSMDAKVAIVGKTGLVTIVGEGTTKIYCYSADGYCTASISVTGLPEEMDEEEEEKYVIVWFPVSQAGGGYIIDGKTFEENTIKIPYGSDIRFQLVNNKGFTVKVNGSGAYYPDEEGYYTVKNVTEDISILVFTSGDNELDDEITNNPAEKKSFFEKLGEFFRKIVLWFRSLFGMN